MIRRKWYNVTSMTPFVPKVSWYLLEKKMIKKLIFTLSILLSLIGCKKDYPESFNLNGDIFKYTQEAKTDGYFDAHVYQNKKKDTFLMMVPQKKGAKMEGGFRLMNNYLKSKGYKLETDDKYTLGLSGKNVAYLTYNSKSVNQLTIKLQEDSPKTVDEAYEMFTAIESIK